MKGTILIPTALALGVLLVGNAAYNNKVLTEKNEQLMRDGSRQQVQTSTSFENAGEGTDISPPSSSAMTSGNGVEQVDWVFEGSGRCWSAWSVGSCTKLGHEGGVLIPAMRDFDHDGRDDISCSQGNGSNKSSTITNISNKNISINCEKYTCTSCTSGNGTQAQCDGSIDASSSRLVETLTLTPGCTATCTMNGAYGSCLTQKTPSGSPQPTSGITVTPRATQPPLPTTQPSIVPSSRQPTLTPPPSNTQPLQTTTPRLPTATASPRPTQPGTGNTKAQNLPLFVDYQEYTNGLQGKISDTVTVYVYARGMDTAIGNSSKQAHFERHINGLRQIKGNVKKIVMTSTLTTTEYLLENFSDEMKAAGVEYIAMDTERSVLTPETELRSMESTDPNVNAVAIFARKSQEKGFKSIWGPIRADGSRIINRSPQAIETMIGSNCWLDGMAFQEQRQITEQTTTSRIQAVSGDSQVLKSISRKFGCTDFHVTMQLMSEVDRCGAKPWVKCKQLVDGVINDIDSLAIWVNGGNRQDLLEFVTTLRR